ncbi:hypothetical protein [Flavimarina sp. Hel_I_48]|uniref:hypothetical protein n=1 Tax=Flavimarina sp. Hel_I_48 TaxID=1392488 RepID=UPI0004DF5DFF|nr:hypothetical protein [Flavimarina sp. Hel_I_48]
MKHLGIVIVDGVGYRNFVLSDFCAHAVETFDRVTIYSGLPEDVYSDLNFANLKVKELPVFKENGKTWFFRKLKEVAHLQHHKNDFYGINANLTKNKAVSNSRRAWLTRLVFSITRIFNSERSIKKFYGWQQQSFAENFITEEYFELLRKDQPNVLFFTHQRPPYLALLDHAAKKLGIKTCSFIFSWDNLPSKGRMAAPFDSFLVWSSLMKKELHYFYPKTKDQTVTVVGTPQFEPYVLNRYASSREYFFERFNLNNQYKSICYSCGDISTSQNDGLYIKVIAEALRDKQIPKVNFIVRTSPAEDGSRFSSLKAEFPFIKWNFPQWKLTRENHPEPWSQRVPLEEDLVDLRSLLEHCDLNINMCSTMGMDFMLFQKPVINPVFGNEENGLYNDQKYLRYSHYERVVASGAVAIVKNDQELISAINESLKNPKARLKQQEQLLDLQIGKTLEGTSERILEALLNL